MNPVLLTRPPGFDPALPEPDAVLLCGIRSALNAGQSLAAWEMVNGYRPLDTWHRTGPEAAFYASRLLAWLGNSRRSDALDIAARKLYPQDADVFLRWLSTVSRKRGLYAMLGIMRDPALHPVMNEKQRVFLLTWHGELLSSFRDFAEAHRLLDEAARMNPDSDRVLNARARVLRAEDRHEEALGFARRAAECRPGNVNAPRLIHDILTGFGRHDEAWAVLREAEARLQDFDLSLSVANWFSERERYTEALTAMDRCERYQPLASAALRRWMNGRRAFWHYLRGDEPEALRCADLAPDSFVAAVAARLRAGAEGRRVRLPVPFVRQNHVTCAPATLAAVSAYFGDPVEHVELAESICYDGTPDHSERQWVADRGWPVREFRVTLEAARQLIDRGVPFTLATVEATSAHLQAVIGYDERAGTLLVREPGWEHFQEYSNSWFQDHVFSGPRGMVFVPPDRAELLEGIDLPEAPLYDLLHELQKSLAANRREEALASLEALRRQAPGHRLTHSAERRMAQHDNDHARQLSAVDALLELFPENRALLYGRLELLRGIAGREEQIQFARKVIAARQAPNAVRLMLADLLDDDARQWPAAEREWTRLMKLAPCWSRTVRGMADFHWARQSRAEALLLYRFSATSDYHNEDASRSYFLAARALGREAEALEFLRGRVARHGRQSGDPAITLAWALESLNLRPEAIEVLEEALALRPDDGMLMLHVSDRSRGLANSDRAEELLERAKTLAPLRRWLRYAADAAASRADPEESIRLRRQLLEIEPLAIDVHRDLASLLAGTVSRETAVSHFEDACARWPGNTALHAELGRWLSHDRPRREPVLRRMCLLDESDAWARRELALDFKVLRRFEEAEAEARAALQIDPSSPASAAVMGEVLHQADRTDEALEFFRDSLRADADYSWGLDRLIDCSRTPAEKRANLEWAAGRMKEQVIEGASLAVWRNQALGVLEPDEVQAILEAAHTHRPDLWNTWSVLTLHHLDNGNIDEAQRVAEGQAERFPLTPRAWLDLATVHARREDTVAARAALERAVELNPRWSTAVEQLAAACENCGDHSRAAEILGRHCRMQPMEADTLIALASLHRRTGNHDQALECARRASRLAPFSWRPWHLLGKCAAGRQADEASVREAAEKLTTDHTTNPDAWECRAFLLDGLGDMPGQLATLQEGARHLPRSWDILDRLALLLAENARYDEALACCSTEGVPSDQKVWRESRAAWITHTRGDHAAAIRLMEEVIAARPDYPWAHSRLMEWYQEKGDWEAVRRVSMLLIRINPRESRGFGFRAEALLELSRPEEAEADLRAAVVLDSGYTWAAENLLKLQLGRGDTDSAAQTVARIKGRQPLHRLAGLFEAAGFPQEAEALCRRAVAEDSGQWRNHTALGDILRKQNRSGEALEPLCKAAFLAPDEESPWKEWYACAGGENSVPAMIVKVRAWCLEAPGIRMRWISLYDIYRYSNAPPAERIAVLDEALTHLPLDERLIDLKASVLAQDRRPAEATAVCGLADRPDHPSAMLRRRAAWICGTEGKRPEAIRLMEEALALEPDHSWGLSLMCEWISDEDRDSELEPWARRLIAAEPRWPNSVGWLAQALIAKKELTEAKLHLRRALSMSHDYEWAGNRLFELLLEDKEWDEAAGLVEFLTRHQPGPMTLAKRVSLAAETERMEDAFASLTELAKSDATEQTLGSAEAAIEKAGWKKQLANAWHQRSSEPGMTPQLARRWMRRACIAGSTRAWREIEGKQWPDDTAEAAWTTWLHEAVTRKWWIELRAAVKRHSGMFKGSTLLWAGVLRFYCEAGLARQGMKWGADWRSRDGLQPWMTVNLADCQSYAAGCRAAREIRQWSVDNLQADHGTSMNRVWLALLAACDGDYETARTHLANIRDADFSSSHHPALLEFGRELTRILLKLGESGRPLRERRREALVGLGAAARMLPGFSRDREARHAFIVFHQALRRTHGGSSLSMRCGILRVISLRHRLTEIFR